MLARHTLHRQSARLEPLQGFSACRKERLEGFLPVLQKVEVHLHFQGRPALACQWAGFFASSPPVGLEGFGAKLLWHRGVGQPGKLAHGADDKQGEHI